MPTPTSQFESSLLKTLIDHIRSQLDPSYEFMTYEERPFEEAPVRQDLRVAVITTAGLHLRTDPEFRAAEERFGDTSYRVIPHGTKKEALRLDALTVDQRFTAKDPEVALPQETLSELQEEGVLGSVGSTHYSFCGGIVRPLPGLEESVKEIVPRLREDGVNALLLLPTCSLCVQTICVLARAFEERGFATVTISLLPELSRLVGAPRSLEVSFPFGAPCGNPGNRDLQRAIVKEMLTLFETASAFGARRSTEHRWRR
ncbi:MAG: glycine/sarcosine/betaine reductase selenoprotein B family protein [Planctomycetota bacterium]